MGDLVSGPLNAVQHALGERSRLTCVYRVTRRAHDSAPSLDKDVSTWLSSDGVLLIAGVVSNQASSLHDCASRIHMSVARAIS